MKVKDGGLQGRIQEFLQGDGGLQGRIQKFVQWGGGSRGLIPVATTFPGWGSATTGASLHHVYALGGPNYLN